MAAIRLIVGLGNPGPQYANTRHNAGVWFAEKVAKHYQTQFTLESKFHSLVSRCQIAGQDCWLAVPTTFMNESGRAVKAIAQFYKIPADEILIAHDELDFEAGTVRLKVGGGHGGHNGLRDLTQQLGTADFARLRIGIGHPGQSHLVHDYVLSKPNKTDEQTIHSAIDKVIPYLPELVSGDIGKVMQALHTTCDQEK